MTGSPEVVLLRGQVLVENDELVASPGIGQFVKRRAIRRGAEAAAPATNRDGAAGVLPACASICWHLPVVLTVLVLVACGGKGGGGY